MDLLLLCKWEVFGFDGVIMWMLMGVVVLGLGFYSKFFDYVFWIGLMKVDMCCWV